MVDVYGNVVHNWRVWVNAQILTQDNNSATVRCVTHFQAVNNFSYSDKTANYGVNIAGQGSSGFGSELISVSPGGSMELVTHERLIAKSHEPQNIGFNGYVNIIGMYGGSSSASGSLTIAPKTSYNIVYNANGGSGQPKNQIKWYDENISLSDTIPTRADYSFLGWSTSLNGDVKYTPGQVYTENSNLNLYAVWKRLVKPPTIISIDAYRCDESGNQMDTGTNTKVTVKWSVDTIADSNNIATKLVISQRKENNAWIDTPVTVDKSSGTNSIIIKTEDITKTYNIKAILTDKYNLSTKSYSSVGSGFYLLDINNDGTGIGIGTSAPSNGVNINGTYLNFIGKDIKYNNILIDPQYAIYKRKNFDTAGSYQTLFLANKLTDWVNGDNAGCAVYDEPITSDPSTFGISPSGKDFIIKTPGTYLLTGIQDIYKNGDYNMYMTIKHFAWKGDTVVDGTRKLVESCPPLMAMLRSDTNQWYRWHVPPVLIKIPVFDKSIDSIGLKIVYATQMGSSASSLFGSRTWIQIIKLPWSC